jgi:multidrug efflux system membrane fusion protein
MKISIRSRLIITLIILIGVGVFIWWYTKPSTQETKTPRALIFSVKTIHPQVKSMPVMIQEVGSVEAGASVNIMPQASGVLKKIYIQQGQMVKAGQLLFEIDSSSYAANVAKAKADLQRDQAQLEFLQATAKRYESLAKLEYVTRQQYEQSLTSVTQQQAVVAADEALLKQQQIQLEYTEIRSPINGRTGVINVGAGDIITANSSAPLVVINRIETVLINFNIAQARLQDVLNYQRAGTLKVLVYNENGDKLLAQGHLAFVGNMVSGQTGTVQVKGEADNADLSLWPGQLVTVRLILTTQPHALVIPSASVQMGQKGIYVYVVKNNKAEIQSITIDRVVNSETVVGAGLTAKDDVITEIPPGLQAGSPVRMENKK